ncbi:Intracellular distribution of mitochondria [Elasticomyces elasticus]|nr:Intracellular distribution of mitochondria [Elasticomyces elasticus]
MAEDGTKEDVQTSTEPNGTTPDQNPNGHATSLTNGTTPQDASKPDEEAVPTDTILKLRVNLPDAQSVTLMVSPQEQIQDIRQSIVDQPHTFQYSCFHLEYNNSRINDFIELSEIPDFPTKSSLEDGTETEPVFTLVEDPYTEAQARMHVVRVRELIGAAGNRVDYVSGVDAGGSLCEDVEVQSPQSTAEKSANAKSEDDISYVEGYDLSAPGPISTLLAKPRDPAPKTVKSLSLSAWNPPPHHLRMRGHLLYLQATTLEGDQHYITSHITGFYVNKSTNAKFDPEPRTMSKSSRAHSLIGLLSQISDKFAGQFVALQEYNGQRDPLASYALSNSIPAAPWMVASSSLALSSHQPDLTRTQEPYLLSGADNAETLRDWNEEFQSTRELPKETVQDRVFRERLTSKLFAEYTDAAVRGAVLVGRGEVQSLNPTEGKDAQIFLYNNVFYSFGADGMGTFAENGGDEAARVASGKDVMGVKAVNQLDISGLFTAGTVVVDYLGKRIIGQSIVPGIFKQRDPGENQIDYGGVEGKDVIACHEGFKQPFQELSKALRVKGHGVWDKEHKRHDLEGSVETKGLLGTDGRKYVLDLYRTTPLDVAWLEEHYGEGQEEGKAYMHRMAVLRAELVEGYRVQKLREYIRVQLAKQSEEKEGKPLANGEVETAESEKEESKEAVGGAETNGEESAVKTNGEHVDGGQANGDGEVALTNGDGEVAKDAGAQRETVDVSGFSFTLNPDVFSGQQPQTDEEKAEMEQDEKDVRAVCTYLTDDVIPRMIREMQEGDVGFPMDGQSLVREMHKRGINARYLGMIARLCGANGEDKRLVALRALAQQEMVARAFKHVVNGLLRGVPAVFAQGCVSHLLNCLVGEEVNGKPEAEVDELLKGMYPEVEFKFVEFSPESLGVEVVRQIALRFRYEVRGELVQRGKEMQLLREICLKLGLQLEAKEYRFTKDAPAEQQQTVQKKVSSESLEVPQTNGVHVEGGSNKKKKKKHQGDQSPHRAASVSPVSAPTTFRAENVVNIVPLVKEASPRSMLAEEALDAGRMSLQQDQKELGQELLLESLSLHEQIYGILHPEVARVYYALSTLYFSLDEKNAAVELAKKAVIVSERTLGVDNSETILAYLNLSLMEHATGNTRNGLAYVRHALDLWKIVYGARHPDSITTINNAAVMLQSMKHFHESRRWFEASLDICLEVAGKESVNTATLLFQYAQALALDHDSKSAVDRMRESRNIFSHLLGEENQNTKEADNWLKTLVTSALNQGKAAKQASELLQAGGGNRRMFMRNGARRLGGMGQRPQASGSAAALDVAEAEKAVRSSGLDKRSLDELVRYVNGDKQERKTKRKGVAPKGRQGRASTLTERPAASAQ